ncbi:hypothetical protein BD311DRAFT_777301 [Dichomitus squalens]|uniref:Uncharacterized protein n=1 Tax=Dichomitus squalens TaxID=114155 RepID=A0A4V2K0R5_9APHY|nr:hypothetical protein BD311DRAFT_777301 [Dichomitus squalens]
MFMRVAHYTGLPASIFISPPIRSPRVPMPMPLSFIGKLVLPGLHWLDKHTSMMPKSVPLCPIVGAMWSQIALSRCPSMVDVSGNPSGERASRHVAVKLSCGVHYVVR